MASKMFEEIAAAVEAHGEAGPEGELMSLMRSLDAQHIAMPDGESDYDEFVIEQDHTTITLIHRWFPDGEGDMERSYTLVDEATGDEREWVF